MKTNMLLSLLAITAAVAGCQTLEQRVEERSKLVCFQAGYGVISPRHQECMETLKPVAMQMERQRVLEGVSDGLSTMAAGLGGRQDGVTCVNYGSVLRCR